MSSLDAVNTLQGYSSDSQDPRTNKVTAALNPLDPYRTGLDVWAHAATSLIATDAAEAGSTQFRVNATAHSAKIGDIIRFTSGTHSGLECPVLVVSANYFDLSLTLSANVGTGDTFEIRRRTSLSVSSTGGLSLADGAKVQGLYPDASLSLSNPIPFAGKDVFSGQTRVPVVFNNLGFDFLLSTPVDPNLGFPYFRAGTGEAYSLVASPDDTKGNARYINMDATTRGIFVQGNVAHDSADSYNPISEGGYALNSGITWPTAVTGGDRVRAFYDLQGFKHVKDHSQTNGGTDLTALNTTYNNVTTTASSADVTTLGYRNADLYFAIQSGGVGTHYVTITVQGKIGASYFTSRCGYLGKLIYEDTATATKQFIHLRFPCPDADAMRVTITATNTTAVLTFTVSEAHLRLST